MRCQGSAINSRIQERMRGEGLQPHTPSCGNPFLDHSRLQQTQEGVEIASPVTRTVLSWTKQAAFILHENMKPRAC